MRLFWGGIRRGIIVDIIIGLLFVRLISWFIRNWNVIDCFLFLEIRDLVIYLLDEFYKLIMWFGFRSSNEFGLLRRREVGLGDKAKIKRVVDLIIGVFYAKSVRFIIYDFVICVVFYGSPI